jgi:hypothetical protein
MSEETLSDRSVRTFSSFVAMLEDGCLHNDLTEELQDLNAAMNNHVINFGGRAKGSLSLNFEFVLNAKGAFEIVSKFKVKKPETPRGKTFAWSTPDNRFTANNPKQQELFKDVNAPKKIKNV